MPQKQRIVYLDCIRVLACCMIVLMHSPHPKAGNPGMLLVPLSFMTAVGIGLFFMVSGALLLPVKTDTSSFLRRRLGKIVGPLFFWTVFYLAAGVITGKKTISSLPYAVASIPFSPQGHGVLWFLYTLVGLYLLSPIISPFLQKASRRELCFYLILWALALSLPMLANVVCVDNSVTGSLYYFSGYVGYFLMGYYLHTYKPRMPQGLILLSFIVPIGCLALYHFYFDTDGGAFYTYFWYLSIFVALMCVAWYSIVQKIFSSTKCSNSLVMSRLSDCCFGVYLVHIFVMRYLLWNIDFIVYRFGGFGQIVLTLSLTLLISFAITWAISYLPYSEYIIGFTSRKKK